MKKVYFKKLVSALVILGVFTASAQGGKFNPTVSKTKYRAVKQERNDLQKEIEKLKGKIAEQQEELEGASQTITELEEANTALVETTSIVQITLDGAVVMEVEISGDTAIGIDEVPVVGEVTMVSEIVSTGATVELDGAVEGVDEAATETSTVTKGTIIPKLKKGLLYVGGIGVGDLVGRILDSIYNETKKIKLPPFPKSNNDAVQMHSALNTDSQNKSDALSKERFDAYACFMDKVNNSFMSKVKDMKKDFRAFKKLTSPPVKRVKADMKSIQRDMEKLERPLQEYYHKLTIAQNLTKDLKNALTKKVSWSFSYPSPTWHNPTRKKSVYIHVSVKDALKGGKHLAIHVKKAVGKFLYKELKKYGWDKFEKEIKREADKVVSRTTSKMKSNNHDLKRAYNKVLDMPELKRVEEFAKHNDISELLKIYKEVKEINFSKYERASHFDINKVKDQCNMR